MSQEREQTLAHDVKLPYLGFGTYLISDSDAPVAVHEAIRAGYRHIDTAEFYQNETGVGEGIRQALKSEGLSRSELFVTTKLWPG
ncbi:MAG TPA: aldo/keto reductase, partial [Polyangiaceae bacterium]